MDACERLYETMGFQSITIKNISTETSFSRPSIYNYFQTKEEIFLGLLTREYMKWNDALKSIIGRNADMDEDVLARAIAKSMEERKTLLKISAMNLYEIEENSRDELLVEYKKTFKDSIQLFDECLKKHLGVLIRRVNRYDMRFFLICMAFILTHIPQISRYQQWMRLSFHIWM